MQVLACFKPLPNCQSRSLHPGPKLEKDNLSVYRYHTTIALFQCPQCCRLILFGEMPIIKKRRGVQLLSLSVRHMTRNRHFPAILVKIKKLAPSLIKSFAKDKMYSQTPVLQTDMDSAF